MKTSPEFHDARLVIVGPPGSGSVELLEAVALHHGGDPPQPLAAGRCELLLTEVTVGSVRIELVCLADAGPYAGVRELLLQSADGVILLLDVSPRQIAESRRFFDALRPQLEEDQRPFTVQYHRIERELRFDPGRMDAWLGLDGAEVLRVSTPSDAPDQPFEKLVASLIPGLPEG